MLLVTNEWELDFPVEEKTAKVNGKLVSQNFILFLSVHQYHYFK